MFDLFLMTRRTFELREFMPLILLLLALLIALISSAYVSHTMKKYEKVFIESRQTGEQVARQILNRSSASDTLLMTGNGNSCYSIKDNAIYLAPAYSGVPSVTAAAVAAHECGHAIQNSEGYSLISVVTTLAPVSHFCSNASVWIVVIGLFLGLLPIAWLGFLLFAVTFLYQLAVLPVEVNANRRAYAILSDNGFLTDTELAGAKKVLTASAVSYIAAFSVTLLQLLRFALALARRSK